MKIVEVIKDYCFQQGLPVPEREEGVIVELLFGDQPVAFDFPPETKALFLRAPLAIAEMQAAELAALYRRLLNANLGGKLSGAWFAINDAEDGVELQLRLEEGAVDSPSAIDKAVAQLYGATRQAVEILAAKGFAASPATPQTFFRA